MKNYLIHRKLSISRSTSQPQKIITVV